MMQPRSPPAAPEEAQQQQGTMMEPARRKRRRPAPKPSGSGSETEDHATSDAHGDDESCDQAVAATTTATRGPFRGKCLYQSRKCENERALKRNGKPHNLCDEHRDKQNQHQRKFDAKKYTRGKRSASEDECHDSDSKDHVNATAGGKRRASVPADKPKRSKVSPATTTAAPPLLPTEISAAYAAANQGHSDPYYLPSSDVRPLEIRRPPALDVLRSSPVASGFALPPLGQHDHRSPQFGGLDLQAATISVPPGTPVDGARAFPSPHGATAVYPFLRPPPQSRSRSFDSGVTRISPMGGAAPGSVGPHAFQLGTTRSPKLPSLQQLPLGQLTRSTSSHLSPYTHQSSYSPYDRPSQQQPHFSFPRPPPSTAGPLLPSLRQPIHLSRSSSLSSPPPHRSYPPHRDHEQHPY